MKYADTRPCTDPEKAARMRNIRVIMTMGLLLVHTAGFANPVEGPGAIECAEFNKKYLANSGFEDALYAWAQGYMSALNAGVMAAKLPPRELAGPMAVQKRALRSYCSDNPIKNYMDGVIEFYKKLPLQRL